MGIGLKWLRVGVVCRTVKHILLGEKIKTSEYNYC